LQNLALKGKINKGTFEVIGYSTDPNLSFDLVANGGFNDKYPKGKLS
jgi:hypothetical protein